MRKLTGYTDERARSQERTRLPFVHWVSIFRICLCIPTTKTCIQLIEPRRKGANRRDAGGVMRISSVSL